MSRIAKPSEKVMAAAGIYKALMEELGVYTNTNLQGPEVAAVLIDCAVRIAMGTDTRDMGIMGVQGPAEEDDDEDPEP